MSKRSAIYKRISSKFQSKSSASGNTLNNEFPRDWKSPALDNAKMIFQLASNLGSGALNVPGLQAAGLIGVQIIDAVKVSIIIYFCFSDATEFIYRNSNLISRMRKILSFTFPSLWNPSSTPYRIRPCKILILIWQQIYCVFKSELIKTCKRLS